MLAFVCCAFPLIGHGQDLQRDILPAPQAAPTPLELPPPGVADAPGLTTLSPNGEITVGDAFEDSLDPNAELSFPQSAVPFGYNLRQSNTSWLIGGGDDFGAFSLESLPTLPRNKDAGIVTGIGFHFLAGPIQTDMPPRLFDFQIGYQLRKRTGNFGYDVAARVGAFSDFEGSAREGVRFPSHAVGYYRWAPTLDLVLGLEYLDRDDLKVLPVVGMIMTPREDLRLELVFPRPMVEVLMSPTSTFYLGGELGGGTWAIERTTMTDDVVTYRDLRLLCGISSRDTDGDQTGFEVGYVFSRDLSYRSGNGDFAPEETVLIRLTHLY